MDMKTPENTKLPHKASEQEEAKTIHDILYREQSPEENERFQRAVDATFKKYDQALRNLAK